MADMRRVLERRLRESLDERPDLPAMVPGPVPLGLRRAQERRLRRLRWWRPLILVALGWLIGLYCVVAWRRWP